MAYTLDWNSAGANGTYALRDGADEVNVTLSTTTNGAGQSASATSAGSPAADGLWVSGLTEAVTTSMNFDAPVKNLSFEIYDIDQLAGSWDDRLTIIALNPAGEEVVINFSDLDGLHTATGNQLDADGNASTGVETSGADDSVTVTIPGPVLGLTFIFDHGESHTSSGLYGVSNMTFDPIPLDYVVEGSAGDDLIDATYVGDPEGDRIDNADAVDDSDDDFVEAGLGNDTVLSGAGDDSVLGDLGDDRVEGGAGNDTVRGGKGDDTIIGGEGDDSLYGNEDDDSILGGDGSDSIYGETGDDFVSGGAGDDHLEGNEGADTIYGGAGNDWMRGSYGNDELHGGTGDDFLWGGYGDDTFVIENDFGNDTIEGENIDEVTGDTLDLSRVTDDLTVDLSHVNPEIGSFSDGTSTAEFVEVEHIILGGGVDTLILRDGSGADAVSAFTAPADNGDGTYSGVDQLDVSGLTNDAGDAVNVNDVVVTDSIGDGTGDAILTFPGGESLKLQGVLAEDVSSPEQLIAMGIPAHPGNFRVEGTAAGEQIDTSYMGDPEGDRVDNNDHSDGSNDDYIETGEGRDTVYAGAGDDTVDAGSTSEANLIYGEDGGDSVLGGAGDDTVYGGIGHDELFGYDGNDSLFGDAGADTLKGGSGDDYLSGGEGFDQIFGGIGDDTIWIGEGDSGEGGKGDDLFLVSLTGEAGSNNATVIGGEGDETQGDTLDFGGQIHWDDVTYTNPDPGAGGGKSGFATLDDGSTLTFSEIENVIICFAQGTRISTAQGLRPVEELQVGDLVVTRDHGLQPVRWAGRRAVAAQGAMAPIRFEAGALGNCRPLLVSPQHRMLITGSDATMYFGESEVLVSAKHLVNGGSVVMRPGGMVTYVHILFDDHEIVYAEGVASESFYPGDTGLSAVDEAAREELFTLFPELRDPAGNYGTTARMCLRRHEARLLGLGIASTGSGEG